MAIGATAASLIAAGVGTAGAVGGSLLSNKGNANIAQQGNEFNEKMFDKQVAYDKEMYQQQLGDQWEFYNDAKQNAWDMAEYNSAPAQRERLEAAGLNPYLMMNGGSAGTAQSSVQGSAPSVQGVNPPTATPYSVDYSGITQGLGMALDQVLKQPERDVKNAEANNLRIEGKYKAAKMIAEIVNMRTDAKTKEGRLALDKLIYSIDKDLKTSQMSVNSENIANMQAQRKLINVQTLFAEKQLSWMDAQNKMDLAQKTADIQLKYAQGALTKKQVDHEINKIAETAAKTSLIGVQKQGQSLQNQFDSATFGNRVKTVKETLWNLMYNSYKGSLVDSFVVRGGRALQQARSLFSE
ncbi:hypothetical protein [Bacteroides thetaiotaomicron]|uniref:hypothetical protein n=1 Tax=Bacteroides thetaiotaomicron TaxID=818 RepID=UPI001F1C83D6|nr:hypothetical protein [Bacteroides thetaiotaomicron]MCE8949567.1 hypothetical protein [Bacteroides thetaiotaomicron]MCE8967300.1 hypothetical protein [Bacteroides thetaiotaomicron]DAS30546.1 MAG TPA: DNA pilot protein VP2 [Microviridae sp.]